MRSNTRFLPVIPREKDNSNSYWPTSLSRKRNQLSNRNSWSKPISFQPTDLPSYEISFHGVGQFGAKAMDALAHLGRSNTILPLARFYLAKETRSAQVAFVFGRLGETGFESIRKNRLHDATELVFMICPQDDPRIGSISLDHRESLIRVPANITSAQINSIVHSLCPWARGCLGSWDDPLSFLDMFGGRMTQVRIIETLAQQVQTELGDFYRKRPKSFIEAEKILIHQTVANKNMDLIPRLNQVFTCDILKRWKGIFLHQGFFIDPDMPNPDMIRLIMIPIGQHDSEGRKVIDFHHS